MESKDNARLIELLELQIVFQMAAMGATQQKIASTLKKGKAWVNSVLQGMPKDNRD